MTEPASPRTAPLRPAQAGRSSLVHCVGEDVLFEGYADDFEGGVAGVQFSLDGGLTWTTYNTPGVREDRGVRWSFTYRPQRAGRYLLRARALAEGGVPSSVVSSFAFEVIEPAAAVYGGFALRAVGGLPLRDAMVYRSRELHGITAEEATFLVNALGVGSIYDVRNQWEVAERPEPCLVGVKMVALEPREKRRDKNAKGRLCAGVIGEYGEPGQRMCANYRRYVNENPLLGMVLRTMAAEGRPALVHCKNGKDRTGVLSAVLLRVAGASDELVMHDYLLTNEVNAARNACELEEMGAGMTAAELAILQSFFDARPQYLQAFFDEVDLRYGSFERYVEHGLRLSPAECDLLRTMVAVR